MTPAIHAMLPHNAPQTPIARIILVAMRHIAIGGIDDASAANLFISMFGMNYRRPLMFLRVLMQEVSRTAVQPIIIAPCCCPRMTKAEASLLHAITCAAAQPQVARVALARVTGTLDVLPPLSVAQALGDALDDLGHPLRL